MAVEEISMPQTLPLKKALSWRNGATDVMAVVVMTFCCVATGASLKPGVASGDPLDEAGESACPLNGILHNQLPGSASTDAITSQNFGLANYDSAAADDFVVPAGTNWRIKAVRVRGVYFNGTGPTPTVDVTFYTKNGVLPGNVVCSYPNMVPIPWPNPPAPGNLRVNNLNCTLPSGSYFVSVVANMNIGVGQWGWRLQPAQNFDPAAWRNPGGGFSIGCPVWGNMAACLGVSSPDLAFSLRGCTF